MMVVVLVVLVRAVSDEEMRTCQNISKLSPDGISLLSITPLYHYTAHYTTNKLAG